MKFSIGGSIDRYRRRGRLALLYERDVLRLCLARKGGVFLPDSVLLRETPDDVLARKLKIYRDQRPASVVLVLPRSMLLERRFDFRGTDPEMSREIIMKRIRDSLPLDLEELAYAVSAERRHEAVCAELLAVPLKNIEGVLKALDDSGLSPDEIVSSDQALLGLAAAGNGSCFLINHGPGTAVMVLAEKGLVKAGKTIEMEGCDLRREIDFFLLEAGVRPDAFFAVGGPVFAAAHEVWQRIDAPAGVLPELYGACGLNLDRVASLLPRERKVRKRETLRRKALLRLTAWVLPLTVFLFAAVAAHGLRVNVWAENWRLEYKALKPELEEIRAGLRVLDELRSRQGKTRAALDFLRNLTREIPSGVTLSEVEWKQGEIRLRGMSADYAGVSSAVKAAERAGYPEASLDYARVRKKESREYFEFAVTAGQKDKAMAVSLPDPKIVIRPGSRNWRERAAHLVMARRLVREKTNLLADYAVFLKQRDLSGDPASVLNDWIHRLMTACENHNLKIRKLEPQGRPGTGRFPDYSLRLSCDGRFTDLAALIHDLASGLQGETVEELSLSRGRDSRQGIACEAVLSKM